MRTISLLALPLLFAGCVALGLPVFPVAPTAHVKEFESRLITPQVVGFHARIVIRNRMLAPLEIEEVEWGADVNGRPLFTESFTELVPMNARGAQWVTLPFQIGAKDALGGEPLRIRFHGLVHTYAFDPVPFEATRVIPIPRLPLVELEGVEADPHDGQLTVLLDVHNRNDYAMTLSNVDAFVNLDGRRHDLRRTDAQSHLGPGATGRLRLTVRRGWIELLPDQAELTIGGSIACQTPYGTVLLPVELGPASEARVEHHRSAGG